MSLYDSIYFPLYAGMDFNDTQPFEVTIPAGMTTISGDIPIVDDEINEGTEEFVVVLEVASVTTNSVDFTGQTQNQTTVCRISANDRKCHLIMKYSTKCHAWPNLDLMQSL